MIPTKHLYLAVLIVSVAILGGMVLHAYFSSVSAATRADQVKQNVQEQIDSLHQNMDNSLARILADKRQAQTPPQILMKLPEYVPGLVQSPVLSRQPPESAQPSALNHQPAVSTQPPVVNRQSQQSTRQSAVSGQSAASTESSESATAELAATGDNRLAAEGLYFPPRDVKPLFDRLADCKANEAKLGECQQEIPLLTQRAEAAEKAMQSGGFWHRLKSGLKIAAVSGAIGVAAGYAAHR